MDDLKRRICATIVHGAALSLVACTSASPTEKDPLIANKQPISVAKVTKKPKVQCGVDDPKKVRFPSTDPSDKRAYRRLVCISYDELSKQKLACADINETNAQRLLNVKINRNRCGGAYLTAEPDVCGPVDRKGKQCCYAMNVRERWCVRGRPFIVEGMLRTTECAQREGWLDEGGPTQWPGLDVLPDTIRQEIAASWALDGCHEHASIASFSAFLMDLLALGAPKTLIEQTTQAIADEIDHAARCFTIASAYAGVLLGPETLDTTPPDRTRTLEAMLKAAIDEGCIGETCAAYEAGESLRSVEHPYLVETLQIICEDETNHALLAWAFVDWVLDAHPEMVSVARDAFYGSPMATQPSWLTGQTSPEQYLKKHGLLSNAAIDTIRDRAYHDVVLPCAEVLLSKHTPAPSSEITTL